MVEAESYGEFLRIKHDQLKMVSLRYHYPLEIGLQSSIRPFFDQYSYSSAFTGLFFTRELLLINFF